MRRNSPMRSRRPAGCGRNCRNGLAISKNGRSASPCCRWARPRARGSSASRDERLNEHGVSHFLEHMAFKGTRRRTARQIAEEIEAVGGDLNAATGAESTAYYARVLKQDVPLALHVLSDILSEPACDQSELVREQGVIVQEIG